MTLDPRSFSPRNDLSERPEGGGRSRSLAEGQRETGTSNEPPEVDVVPGTTSAERPRTSEQPASVLVADPPWRFGDKLPGPGRGAAKHYDTLSVAELCAFPLPPLADDCFLFLWRVAAMQAEALEVMRAWGFTLKTELVWLKRTTTGKRHFGMGRTLRAEHETCLVGTRGRPVVKRRDIRSTFEAVLPERRHSAKPEAFFDLVESLADGPYAELFARRRRPGWRCFGNQLPEETP